MIPRLTWSPQGNFHYIDENQRRLNRTVHNYLVSSGGLSYRHVELEGFLPGLLRHDLMHLSDISFNIFNMGLQNLIDLAIVLGRRRPANSLLVPASGD